MRQIFFALTLVFTLTFASICAAQDVWIEKYKGVDIYVMDDTIRNNSSADGKFVSISVKEVKNGEVSNITTLYFTRRAGSDKWYYSTRRIGGETELTHNKIFEFCMREVGWSYTTDGHYYY